MKLLEVRIPNSDDHIAIYYEGEVAQVFLWADGEETGHDHAPTCEVIADNDLS